MEITDINKFAAEQSDKEYIQSQQNLINLLRRENEELRAKVAHSEELMKSLGSAYEITGVIMPEELICIEQIKILKDRSFQRELTLEEIKKLDLLVKNLRLIRQKDNEDERDVTDYSNMSEADLVKLVTS